MPPVMLRGVPPCRMANEDWAKACPQCRMPRHIGEDNMSLEATPRATRLVTLGLFGLLCATSALAKPTIVTFDPAGSIGTYPWRSNEDGTITGFWYDSTAQETKGFLRA